jgi:hypothetical protein
VFDRTAKVEISRARMLRRPVVDVGAARQAQRIGPVEQRIDSPVRTGARITGSPPAVRTASR